MSVVFEFNCAVCFIVHLAFMLSLSHHHKHYHLTLALLSPFLCIVIIIVHVLFSGLAVTCRLRRLISWHFTYIQSIQNDVDLYIAPLKLDRFSHQQGCHFGRYDMQIHAIKQIQYQWYQEYKPPHFCICIILQ
jgi:hypothetical protein